jgi:hypothetical protein
MIVHVRFIVSSAPAIDGRQHRTDFGVDERRCRHERQHRTYGDSLYNIGDDGRQRVLCIGAAQTSDTTTNSSQLILSEEDEPGQQCQQREELISLTRSTHSPAQTTRDCKVVSSR